MTKLQKINKAASQIMRAENVSHEVAMQWTWQCWTEWKAREAKWEALRARAELLKKFPAAAKPARVGGVVVYSTPADPTARALRKRAEKEAQAPPALVSAEEYFGRKAKQEYLKGHKKAA